MAALKVGAGKATIHFPESFFPMEGFKGIHDDPHVRVIAFDCGEIVAIAAMELVNIPDEAIAYARKVIAEKLGTIVENVWVHATHAITTPHAPHAFPGHTLSPEEQKKADEFVALVNAASTEAAEQAAASMTAAVVGVGEGHCDVNTNRDIETPFGWWTSLNPEGISNKTATIVKAINNTGKTIGVLINYDLKPCAIDNSEMEKNNRLVSSDLPGYACNALEEKYGCPVVFTMAAAGDQVPKEQAWYDVVDENGNVVKIDNGVEAGLEIVERLGKQMTAEVGAIIDGTECNIAEADIKVASTSIKWGTKGRTKMELRKTFDYVQEGEAEVTAEIITLGDTAFVAVKPETNTVTALQLKEKSQFSNTMLISMVNGGMKYMPDKAAYENVSWESQSSSLMPGAAEAWVENTVTVLNALK